jgi:hypothetical protein
MAEDKERGNYNNEETECRAKHYPKGGTLQKQTGVGRMAHKTVRTGLHDSVVGRYGHVYREETAQVHDGPPAQSGAGNKETRSKPPPGEEAGEQPRTCVAKRGKMTGDD